MASCARPLLYAGPAAVAGSVLAESGSLHLFLGALAAALLMATKKPVHGIVVASALVAGAAAHGGPAPRAWPRAPPALATCALEVVSCGEDPLRNRGWCVGRREDGASVLCSWNGRAPPELLPGARISVSGRFFLPRPAGNPGERGPRERLAARGITLQADLRTERNIHIERPAAAGWRAWFARTRRTAARRLANGLPADVAPLGAALMLGIRTGLEDTDRLRYERTGTMHMLAISGLHVILLAGLVHALLLRLGAGPRTAALVTLLLAWAYVPLTGAATPVRRAVTVLTTYGLALVRGRKPDAWSALSGAALVLVLHEPHAALGVGFHLSFAASAGIVLLAGPWHARWGRRHRLLARFPAVRADRPVALRLKGYVLRALPVSLAAWLATQAIAARAFGTVTPLAPFTNLVAVPFLALLLPLLALFCLGLDVCAGPLTWTVRVLHGLLDSAAALPGAFLFVAAVPAIAVAAWGCGCLLLRARTVPALLCLAAAAAVVWAGGRAAPLSVHLLDVGHGQAAIIRFDDGAAVLVDGGSRTRRRLAQQTLLPALRRLGVRRLSAVVCTHADADHWNALPSVLARVPAEHILGSPPLARSSVHAGQTIYATPRARLSVLAAGGDGSRNDRSVVLLLEVGRERVLFPADREESGLHNLMAQGIPRCDVVIAPHHGARCDAAFAFGAAARPRWLLVSAARGFAHVPTLHAYGGRVLSTWKRGCLVVRFGPLSVEAFR